jgi:glycyl-tRNA synthetase beta chain
MRWGEASASTASIRWVRPLQGIVALLGRGDRAVRDRRACSPAPPRSATASTIPGIITIGSANDYAEKLRACHVVVDAAERRRIIAEGRGCAGREAGLQLVEDEGPARGECRVSPNGRCRCSAGFDPAFLRGRRPR